MTQPEPTEDERLAAEYAAYDAFMASLYAEMAHEAEGAWVDFMQRECERVGIDFKRTRVGRLAREQHEEDPF